MRRPGHWKRGLGHLCLMTCLALVLAGCGAEAASPPTAVPFPTPTPQPTVAVGFAVVVTPVAHHSRPRPRPTATPSPFRPPSGPYLTLSPRSGPPTSQTISVRGGHLPPSQEVDLEWAPRGNTSPVSTTTYTGSHGDLRAQFTVPGSPPGVYRVVAVVGGVPYAVARYRVVSAAALTVAVARESDGEQLAIDGRHFLPHLRLLLISYGMTRNQKPIIVGSVRSDAKGRFSLTKTIKALAPGQYVLRAAALDSYAAQVADAFYQVVM